jgi:hypothetical protein
MRARIDLRRSQSTIPFHVERNPRWDRKYPRLVGGRSRNSQTLREGVGKVVIIENVQVAHTKTRARAVEVNLNCVITHRDHPKDVVSVNVNVVIVNLRREREIGRSSRSGVQVQSNKGERASVLSTVRADEFALTETHIGTEAELHRAVRVCSCSAAVDVR